MRLGVPIAS